MMNMSTDLNAHVCGILKTVVKSLRKNRYFYTAGATAYLQGHCLTAIKKIFCSQWLHAGTEEE